MDISALDLFTSMASGVMNATGFALGYIAFRKWRDRRNNLLLITAVLFVTIPITWLIDVIIVLYAMSGSELSPGATVAIAAFGIPIFVGIWLYLTGSLYTNRPWLKQLMLGIAIVSALMFYISVYGFGQAEVSPITEGSVLKNIDYIGPAILLIYIYGVLGLVFVVPTYIFFSIQTSDPLLAFRFRMIALGVLSFDISAVADAILRYDELWFFLLSRLLILLSLILLNIGYNTPERIRQRYR